MYHVFPRADTHHAEQNDVKTLSQRFTIYDSVMAGPARGSGDIYNSIIRGNVSQTGVPEAFASADRSCLEDAAAGTVETDCVRCNPRFKGTADAAFVPRSSQLRGKASVCGWMSDPDDARSRDLNGSPRLRAGVCDIGAYTTDPSAGMTLIVH